MENSRQTFQSQLLNILLSFLAVLLFAVSVYSVYAVWQSGIEQSRLETTSDLLGVHTSPRVSETPGINAWVVSTLLEQKNSVQDDFERLSKFVLQSNSQSIPTELKRVTELLRLAQPADSDVKEVDLADFQTDSESTSMQFRRLRVLKSDDVYMVETRSSQLTEPSDIISKLLLGIHDSLAEFSADPIVTGIPKLNSGNLARVYLVNEKLTFTSLPIAPTAQVKKQEMVRSEISELQKNGRSPTFATNEFFFRFDFTRSLAGQATYSGVYLDQGGLGLVATVAVPRSIDGVRCVLAADIVFDVDWDDIVSSHSPILTAEVIHIDKPNEPNWAPWNSFKASLSDQNSELRDAVTQLAKYESINSYSVDRKSVYHASAVKGEDVVAIQVNRSSWILLLVKKSVRSFPWWTIGFSGLFFAFLITRIEFARRSAIGLQKNAARELDEKQNLLNTMQVPLMVVDPNTDQVIFCNEAASKIGMRPKMTFAKDILLDSEAAQSRYRDMQVFSDESRRAYGVPIRVREEDENGQTNWVERYAIIRSVGVTAPIRALNADQRHRLGILFIVNQDFDLQILMEEFQDRISTTEKRLLSGLMNHGIDSLSRILSEHISKSLQESNGGRIAKNEFEFIRWLSNYLTQRITVVAWILENWGGISKSHEQRILTRESVENTVGKFQLLFEMVVGNRTIREQLHWNNGVLSSRNDQNERPKLIAIKMAWNNEFVFQIPIDGAFGFFIGEALVNAVRHGSPGTMIQFSVDHDVTRNEFFFKLTNQVEPSKRLSDCERDPTQQKPYGGSEIMKEIARFSGWSEPQLTIKNGTAEFSWSINSIRQKVSTEVD